MKNFKLLLLLFTAATLSLSSCKKDKQDAPKGDNQAQIEAKAKIMGRWNLVSAVFVKTTTAGQVLAPENWDHAASGYYFDFKTDNTVQINYKTLANIYNFSFSEDGKTFTAIKSGTTTIICEVKQNTATQLVLERNHVLADGTEKETITLQKQP